ncbi:MAG: hypothetical protein K2Q10_07505, partial [Rhodospirillales bacterium]|nr:hypothetical protein [Rhodospirillales bacterium]
DRFLVFSLFQGKLLSAGGFLLDFAALLALAYCAYRLTLARKMTSQYPWLYEQVGPFTWRQRNAER